MPASRISEFFEVFGDELGPVVADDARPGLRVLLSCALHDQLDLSFSHRWANLVMKDGARSPVEN
jgi:hypothetical protein